MHLALLSTTGEARTINNADYAKYVEGVMSTLTDAERAVDVILRNAKAAAEQTPTPKVTGSVPTTPTKETPSSPKQQPQRPAELAGGKLGGQGILFHS